MSGSKYRSKSRGQSHLVIEWTNQHGCGHGDLDCNIVLQYMCQDNRYESLDDTRKNKDIDTIRNGMNKSDSKEQKYTTIHYTRCDFHIHSNQRQDMHV